MCSSDLEKAGLLGECGLHGQPCLRSRGKRCPLGSAGPGEEQAPWTRAHGCAAATGRPLSGLLTSCLQEAECRGESPEPLPKVRSRQPPRGRPSQAPPPLLQTGLPVSPDTSRLQNAVPVLG